MSENSAAQAPKALKFNWGDRILSLPREPLLGAISGASETNLKVLILAGALDELRGDFEALRAELSRRLDYTPTMIDRALEYWQSAGVLTYAAAEPVRAADVSAPARTQSESADSNDRQNPTEQPKKHLQSGELPHYSEGDCADLIEKSSELAGTIDMCQQILGKLFTPSDVAVIVGLADHLQLDGDYIVTLVNYCADKGKKSLRYIERCALSLFDEGINTGELLGVYLKRREVIEDNIVKLRRLLGAADRELTAKEKKLFTCWLEEWSFDVDIVTKAWEITVDKIGKPDLNYINRVLENWHKSGFRTAMDVDASLEAYKKSKAEAEAAKAASSTHSAKTIAGAQSGFETDEIMEAILKRSYGTGN